MTNIDLSRVLTSISESIYKLLINADVIRKLSSAFGMIHLNGIYHKIALLYNWSFGQSQDTGQNRSPVTCLMYIRTRKYWSEPVSGNLFNVYQDEKILVRTGLRQLV